MMFRGILSSGRTFAHLAYSARSSPDAVILVAGLDFAQSSSPRSSSPRSSSPRFFAAVFFAAVFFAAVFFAAVFFAAVFFAAVFFAAVFFAAVLCPFRAVAATVGLAGPSSQPVCVSTSCRRRSSSIVACDALRGLLVQTLEFSVL